jgi:predicted  nucleic acid-binding Zn-ribbon protein
VGRTDDLEKIEKDIKDTETRLKTLKTSMEALDLEIKKITTLEHVLIDNVKILKKQQVIAIAKEFGHAKDELKKVRARLVDLENDRQHFYKVYKEIREILKSSQLQFSKMISESKNNVIRFRRKNGKK